MRKLKIIILICFWLSNALYSNPPEVTNIKVRQTGPGGLIHIYYDLSDPDGDKKFKVSIKVLKLADDNENSVNIYPKKVIGDIGDEVTAGKRKHIIWDASADVKENNLEEYINKNFIVSVIADDGNMTEEEKEKALQEKISKGKEYLNKKIYDSAIKEFESAVNLGAKGEAETLLSEAKEEVRKKREGYFIGKYKIIEPIEGEKVVIDSETKLMWVWNGDLAGREMNWNDAIDYCKNLKYAGYTDWRLPEIQELKTLIKKDEKPTIDNKAFDCRDDWYWSATEYAPDTIHAMDVDFILGFVSNIDKTNYNYVRCVRAGP